MKTLFTIGHSNHEFDVFVALLRRHGVEAVADVRSQPYGRLDHFHKETLAGALPNRGIRYAFLGQELGARRTERSAYEGGQASYARIARLPDFLAGLERVRRGLERHAIALLCSEKEPLDCHRTILVCRHLRGGPFEIAHIHADGTLESHAAAEQRLLKLTGVEPSLFELDITQRELIERAYDQRGREIAYIAEQEEVRP